MMKNYQSTNGAKVLSDVVTFLILSSEIPLVWCD